MKIDVPFYTQKWSLSDWENLGFESYEDALYWQNSSCGVLCLQMAVDAIDKSKNNLKQRQIIDYIKNGLRLSAYSDSRGWSHDGLARIAKAFGHQAEASVQLNPADLQKALDNRKLPIVSIKWAFENSWILRDVLLFWKKRGGHLVLVTGYEVSGSKLKGFYVHHTSTLDSYNWKHKFIPLNQFVSGYTGRCVLVGP